jgi:hypothetical protein
MPVVHLTVRDCAEFWEHILVPDFDDCRNHPDDLRKAFHCAISLFHMSDWIFVSYQAQVSSSFTYNDRNGAPQPVVSEQTFATALRDFCGEFELIRGIANSAKHLQLRSLGRHLDSPSHAANTRVQSTGWGSGGFGMGPYSGTARVMLEASSGDLEFSTIATNVRDMWKLLATQNGWPMS